MDERLKLTHRLEGYAKGVSEELAAILEEAREELEAKIVHVAALAESKSALRKKKELKKLRSEIKKILAGSYKEIGKEIETKAVEIGTAAPEITDKVLKNHFKEIGFKVSMDVPTLDPKQVKSWIESTQIEGGFFADWLEKLKKSSADRLMRETTKSMILNEPLRETAKRVQNSLGVSRKSATDLALNAINTAYNYGEVQMYYENEDMICGFRHVSELDRRTSPICRQLSGKRYEKGTEVVPPLHHLCRSFLSPIYFLDKLNRGGRIITRQDSDARTVRHRDGTTSTKYEKRRVKHVPEGTTYSQWLKSLVNSKDPKDVAFAREALGKTRFDLLKSGKIKMESLYYHGKLRNIKELKRLL